MFEDILRKAFCKYKVGGIREAKCFSIFWKQSNKIFFVLSHEEQGKWQSCVLEECMS